MACQRNQKADGGRVNYPPLNMITHAYVDTAQAAHYLKRKPRTLHQWTCNGNGPLPAVRMNGRLMWPVQKLKELVGDGGADAVSAYRLQTIEQVKIALGPQEQNEFQQLRNRVDVLERRISELESAMQANDVRAKPERVHVPLDREVRETLDTESAAFHLNRSPQTLREWASKGNGPIRPLRIGGLLAWPVRDIRRLQKS